MKKVLIIDDDTYICNLLENILNNNGYNATAVYNRKTAMEYLKKNTPELVLCDYRLPEVDGMEMLQTIKSINKDIIVIIITAYADIRMAVKLIKSGAYDYVTKPIHHDEILDTIKTALSEKDKKVRNQHVSLSDFVEGKNREFRHIMELVDIVAPTDMSVIIEGETGSGKEYLARRIHNKSKRKDKPFVAVDCGALPKELAGSELFGHVKGAFTGAVKDKTGLFSQANKGTIFLDEIANLPHEIQMKLLRAIQERIIYKIGDNKVIKVDVRLLVASNEDLFEAVKEKKFREDLYHRLNEFKLTIPPLRQRTDDIPIYANYFLEQANKRLNKTIPGFSAEAMEVLTRYPWYGNLRELKNVVNRAVLLSDNSTILPQSLPDEIRNFRTASEIKDTFIPNSELKGAAHEAEKSAILKALEQTKNNKTKAALLLNIDRKTLYNKLKLYQIEL